MPALDVEQRLAQLQGDLAGLAVATGSTRRPRDLTVPTGVITAAVPQAKTSVSVPFSVSRCHWSMEIRPSSDS